MIKIKDIHERVHKDPKEYNELRFLIARRIFIIIVAAYFTSLLFTVGGFYGWVFTISVLSMVTFHLYSLLVIATVWFAFSIGEYFAAIYMPGKGWFAYIILVLFMAFGGAALYVHLLPVF